MRTRRFTEAQTIGMPKEQEAGLPTLSCAASMASAQRRFYKVTAEYGGMELSDTKRLKQLEEENAKLKRLVAEVLLDNIVLKDLPGSPDGAGGTAGRCVAGYEGSSDLNAGPSQGRWRHGAGRLLRR